MAVRARPRRAGVAPGHTTACGRSQPASESAQCQHYQYVLVVHQGVDKASKQRCPPAGQLFFVYHVTNPDQFHVSVQVWFRVRSFTQHQSRNFRKGQAWGGRKVECRVFNLSLRKGSCLHSPPIMSGE